MHQNKFFPLVLIGNSILLFIVLFLLCKNWQYINIHEREFRVQKEIQSLEGIVREDVYEEKSPDGKNTLTLYEVVDIPEIDNFIAIKERTSKIEKYIFVSDFRDGFPKWLGNEHIFFTSYCGSSCQGIYLVNVFSKETRQGVLSYMINEDNKPVYTHFRDWFGHEFRFDGWVAEISSDTIRDETYLIFYMIDDNGKSIGQKKFLYTGNELKEK